MKLGICTRYSFCEATEAATAVAKIAIALGVEVTIIALRERQFGMVDPVCDPLTISPVDFLFTNWVADCDVVLWTHIPHIEQISYVRALKKKAILFALWSEWGASDRQILGAASKVLCPFQGVADFLHKWSARGIPCGFAPALPQMTRLDSQEITSILLPLHGRWVYRTEMTALAVLARVLARRPNLTATILYSAFSLRGSARRLLKRFESYLNGRITLTQIKAPYAALRHFVTHDLVFWPAHVENTGAIPLTAAFAGAGLVTFQMLPLQEWFNQDTAVVANCHSGRAANGISVITPDYVTAEAALLMAVDCPDLVLERRAAALRVAAEKHKLFTTTVENLLTE